MMDQQDDGEAAVIQTSEDIQLIRAHDCRPLGLCLLCHLPVTLPSVYVAPPAICICIHAARLFRPVLAWCLVSCVNVPGMP